MSTYPDSREARPQALASFDLCGGHPALDFVNTLKHRYEGTSTTELLEDYQDLLRFARQTGILTLERARALEGAAPAATAGALREARELREALAGALYRHLGGRSPAAADVRVLERHFVQSASRRELRWGSGAAGAKSAPLQGHWSRSSNKPELPVWLLADSAAELLMSGALEQVRACDVETCRWLFLDTSKNHSRRWCDMKVCGNRMKARRFRSGMSARAARTSR